MYIRVDHGFEFISSAVADWWRLNGTGNVFIDPGSAWQNGWMETFKSWARNDQLNAQQFDNLSEVKVLTGD